MIHHSWATFCQLITTPFEHAALIWGIVPLYFGLLLNELTSSKANYRTALQTGFSLLWAGAQWLWPYLVPHASHGRYLEFNAMLPSRNLAQRQIAHKQLQPVAPPPWLNLRSRDLRAGPMKFACR